MKPCQCMVPIETDNPRMAGTCAACGFGIDAAWLSNDKTVAAFFDRLAEALPGWPDSLPPEWEAFRGQCEAREREGRKKFGLRFLWRNNCAEAREEAADGANYHFFHALQKVRDDRRDEDIDCDLMAAYHFYRAWCFSAQAEAKGHHAP